MRSSRKTTIRIPSDLFRLITIEMGQTSESISDIINKRLRMAYSNIDMIEAENKNIKARIAYNEERLKLLKAKEKKGLSDDVDLVV